MKFDEIVYKINHQDLETHWWALEGLWKIPIPRLFLGIYPRMITQHTDLLRQILDGEVERNITKKNRSRESIYERLKLVESYNQIFQQDYRYTLETRDEEPEPWNKVALEIRNEYEMLQQKMADQPDMGAEKRLLDKIIKKAYVEEYPNV